MNKNKKIGLIVGLVIVLCVVFYGGMVYGKSQIPAQVTATFGQNGTIGARGARGMGGGFTTGQIISKDANSITVQLMTGGAGSATQPSGPASPSLGGSKIIFIGANTTVAKTVAGSANDLTVGAQVSITGTANTDGSVNAQSVQIRPNTPPVLK